MFAWTELLSRHMKVYMTLFVLQTLSFSAFLLIFVSVVSQVVRSSASLLCENDVNES